MEIDELNAEIEKMEKSIANAKRKIESCEKKRKKLLQEVYNNKYLRLSELQICYVREIYRLDLDRYDVIDFKAFMLDLDMVYLNMKILMNIQIEEKIIVK